MLAIHFPTSPIVESHSPSPFPFPSSPAHHHQQQTFSPLSFAPLPLQKKPAARPKLSLKITAADTRTFGSKSSSALKAPLTAGPLSPNALATMRNTQMNARRPTSEVPQLSMPTVQTFSSSSSSSSDECSTPVDDDMHSEMKEKSRKRRFQRASHSSRDLLVRTCHPVAPSAIPYNIELPAPQPSKRATNPSARRVHFAEAHIVIPAVSVLVTETYDSADESSSDDSSDSEAEEAPVRTMMEQMVEINKLKSKVEAMDMMMQTPTAGAGEKEEKVGGECSSWMFRLGKIEYDEISKQEASEQCSTPVGFGFGSGIKF
ncbi:hypothetical protein DFP73DRAFT_537058 [Morchella snyderi]|nr:hypothetical protein DFP73DRAFT_537058 [Morchella snyderi]